MLAAVFWGANYAATKYAAEFMPPLLIVALRFTVGGILMFCLLRILEPADRLKPKDLLSVAGLGCLGVAIGQTAFTFGVSMTSAANTGLIFATAPIWGLFLSLMLGLERPTRRGMVGVGLRSWVSASSSTRASGPRVRAWPEISSCSWRRWRSGATPYSRCRCWSVTRRWRWRPTHCSSEGWSSCCSVHRTLPVWSGGASASEHGRLWASRRSSPPLSPSRPGKRAYPASGPTEFWSTNI